MINKYAVRPSQTDEHYGAEFYKYEVEILKNKQLTQGIYAIIFVCTLVLAPLSSPGAAEKNFGQQTFNLLKKLSEKGSAVAQFKLGTFYEYGIFTEKNSDTAKSWYTRAAKKKYRPALDRLTYLDIREKGYNEHTHTEWFKKISREAKKGKSNSLIIFGQMHHHGVIVEKNLSRALNLLRKASLKSHAEIDGEIAEIRTKINVENKLNPVKTAMINP
ncbi:MAG TPA: sel1 repeat family protein [Gammaproteobacteria bacterium]|nr:sel1 repeat family protein [Gammaproteobacteria bacterium]